MLLGPAGEGKRMVADPAKLFVSARQGRMMHGGQARAILGQAQSGI